MTSEPDDGSNVAALPVPGGDAIVRRAPFASNPHVGVRGQQAQARILDAALEVFDEHGYHGCGVKRITELSGCSRASFYQYFSSKEDVFRHLAGKVAHDLRERTEALAPFGPDRAGHESLRAWLDGFSDLYDTYKPVFVTFHTAVRVDDAIATGSARISERTFTMLRSRVKGSPLTAREIDRVIRVLLETAFRANHTSELAESDTSYPGVTTRREVNLAMADAFHRALFGLRVDVNVHTRKRRRRSRPGAPDPAGAVPRDVPTLGAAAQKTRTLLIETGHEVFAERGYYATRVADIARAAEVSHGVFYRYFRNKTQLFEILADRASDRMSSSLDDLPGVLLDAADPTGPTELRRWLRQYAGTFAEEAAIITMWRETMARDPELADVSAAAIARAAEPLSKFLDGRGWGDADADAMVMLVLLDAMISQRVTANRIEMIAEVVERGLFSSPMGDR